MYSLVLLSGIVPSGKTYSNPDKITASSALSRVLNELDISKKFVWFDVEEDPFFHSIGKYSVTPSGEKAFYDYSVDATVVAKHPGGEKYFPVIETLHFDEKLKTFPV